MKATCIDCGRACTPTAYRCKRCQCRETFAYTRTTNKHRTRRAMTSKPRLGDIGEETEIEAEPLEIPQPEPAPQKVPA